MTRTEAIDALLAHDPSWKAISSWPAVMAVAGPVRIHGGTGKRYDFRVRIDVPMEFPEPGATPDVWLLTSPLPYADDGHVNDDGTVCLELPQARQLDYAIIGLVGVLDQVILHLDRLRIHALRGHFPGQVFAHGDAGIRQFLREKHAELTAGLPPALAQAVLPCGQMPPDRTWCPCRSGLRFSQCHKQAVWRAKRRLISYGPFPPRPSIDRAWNPFKRGRWRNSK